VIKLASNNRVFEKMSQDLDISAGNVIEGSESISEVGTRLFEHLRQVASGDIRTKAELLKHREFQFWAEQTVSL
jgi:altronate dehydratase